MNKDLIIDVGMHTGRDTEFYLKKGFNVVGIEASPALVEKTRSRLSGYIDSNRLRIYNVAIADYEGEIDFYVNAQKDDWGTTSSAFAQRNERHGTTNTVRKVKCTTLQNILRESGTPYYLKIDIEGADILCLEAMNDFKGDLPKYISIEAGLDSFDETFTELSLLWCLGYRSFKIVNQAMNHAVKCPDPPKEGVYTDYLFDGLCSGPFGDEAPGSWTSCEETFVRFRRLLLEQRYFGMNGRLFRTAIHKAYERITRQPVGWYDIHARLGK